jgi:hypothetical protein
MKPKTNWTVTERVGTEIKESHHTSMTRALAGLVHKMTGIKYFRIVIPGTKRTIEVCKTQEAVK